MAREERDRLLTEATDLLADFLDGPQRLYSDELVGAAYDNLLRAQGRTLYDDPEMEARGWQTTAAYVRAVLSGEGGRRQTFMGGICQCPACGDLYYGDVRDCWAGCSCGSQDGGKAARAAVRASALAERRRLQGQGPWPSLDDLYAQHLQDIEHLLADLDACEEADDAPTP